MKNISCSRNPKTLVTCHYVKMQQFPADRKVIKIKKMKINHVKQTILDIDEALFPLCSPKKKKKKRIGRDWLYETIRIE